MDLPSCVRLVWKDKHKRAKNIPTPLNPKAAVIKDQSNGDYYKEEGDLINSASHTLMTVIKKGVRMSSSNTPGLKD